MLSVSGARKLELALPAGADVDNWYANRVMGQLPREWRHGGEAAAAGWEVHMGKAPTKVAAMPAFMGSENGRFRSFVTWPNLIGKGVGAVDGSDTHAKGKG
jgi:hypothetical protein